ncbi:MAG TPA: tetratricopeptide repeat protein [Acidobacteriota bacterium]|nr:tetratricopeptide repeat protein [Acidobacteriota bacterium]
MSGNEARDFNGFITRDGEMISIKDTERVSAIFLKTADVHSAIESLWQLTMDCVEAGYFIAACKYIEKILPLVDDPGDKAECLLKMGQALEQLKNYRAAAKAYAQAFDLPWEQNTTWYFLNNNRAYCLIRMGRSAEAEQYCRAAIRIEPKRQNAHKNLGIVLQKLGRIGEAAKSFIRATKLHPEDGRALALLDELYLGNREILDKLPKFSAQLLECHELVQRKAGELPMQ